MTGNGSRPTMKDVARESGVSPGTVSKVFNGIPVGDSCRERVLAAADRLGYRANSYARGFRTNCTHTVALVIPDLTHPLFVILTQHVCQSLSRRGYRMILALTDFSPDREHDCIRMAQQNKVDGIIGLTYSPGIQPDDSVPFVSFDRYFSPGIPCVASDNFGGGQLAARRLTELGCSRLLFFRTASSIRRESDKRGEGFESWCRNRGIFCDSLCVQKEEGYDVLRIFLREHMTEGHLDYDGIFCATDGLVLDVGTMLRDLGLRVPQDVQLIGFDGVPVWGRGLPCSTIVQPVAQLAETCVDIVLKEDRSDVPSLICLPVSYASGGTTRDT